MRQRQADVDAAKEGNRLAYLGEAGGLGVGKGRERVAGEALLLPVVQNIQLDAAAVGAGIAGLVAVPLLVVLFDGRVGEGHFAADVRGPHLYRVPAAGDGAVAQGIVQHHAPGGDALGPVGRGRWWRQAGRQVVAQHQRTTVGLDGLAAEFEFREICHGRGPFLRMKMPET